MKSDPLTADEISKDLDFEVGQQYVRMDLHEVCGGNNQPGISPTTDVSAVFLFGSTEDEEHGYEDRWLPNDRFLLTGVGQEGDQRWEGSYNKSLADHKRDDRRVFLFERVPDTKPTVVTYVGEFEYVTHREKQLPDSNGEYRLAYQFEVRPVEGEKVELPDDVDDLDLATLYEQAKRATTTDSTSSTGSSGAGSGTDSTRSKVVREFALRAANGVCQGCESEAPFKTEGGEPYLEVHHLTKISDEGLDHPDNVIALCSNCHSEVHNGKRGEELNEQLKKKAENRSLSLE